MQELWKKLKLTIAIDYSKLTIATDYSSLTIATDYSI